MTNFPKPLNAIADTSSQVVSVRIFPTFIDISGQSPETEARLLDAFTWADPKAFHKKRAHLRKHPDPAKYKWCWMCRWEGTECLYQDGCLPIGFHERLRELLSEWSEQYEECDDRPARPASQYDWHYEKELRPYQREIVDAMKDTRHGVIDAATGGGKTVCAAAYVCEMGLPTILVVPTKVVFKQFMDEFQKCTNIPVGQIAAQQNGGVIDGPVQIAIVNSLLDDGQAKCQHLRDKDILIADEFHTSASASWQAVVKACSAYYRFGFSATPFRATDLECNMLTGIAGDVIASISTEELQGDGWLCPSDIRMFPVAVRYDRNRQDDNGDWQETTYSDRYRQGIVENWERNTAIAEIGNHCKDMGEKVLVIVAWTDHADILLPLLPEDTIYLSGKDTQKRTRDKLERFKSQDGGVLLGSPVVDVGMDVPAVSVCVMAAGGSYEGRQRQRLGRGLRPSPGKDNVLVLDFLDDDRGTSGRPMFYQHSKARIKAYQSVGQAVTEYANIETAMQRELTLFG